MTDNPPLWYHSRDQECMSLIANSEAMDRDQALEAAIYEGGYEPGDVFYLTRATKRMPRPLDAEDVLERWLDWNEECWGEDQDLDIPKPAIESLQALLTSWFTTWGKQLPTPWAFGNMLHEEEIRP